MGLCYPVPSAVRCGGGTVLGSTTTGSTQGGVGGNSS